MLCIGISQYLNCVFRPVLCPYIYYSLSSRGDKTKGFISKRNKGLLYDAYGKKCNTLLKFFKAVTLKLSRVQFQYFIQCNGDS